MARAQRNGDLSKKHDGGRVKDDFPQSSVTAVEQRKGVRICGGGVKWVETHSYERSREYGIAVASRAGTYGLCEMKHCDSSVNYV
jgi:hypothetical protein